jgi:hypothetical protein
MTVFFNRDRDRWCYDFWKKRERYRGYCLDAQGQPVTSKSAAKQAEGVEKRRVDLEPKVAKPGELTFAMAIAALAPVWQPRRTGSRARSGCGTSSLFRHGHRDRRIDQARVDDYVIALQDRDREDLEGRPHAGSQGSGERRFGSDTGKPRSVATVNLYLGTLREIFGRADAHRDPMASLTVSSGCRP